MSFSSYSPDLVDSIVLLAPGGILRSLPKEYENPCFRYPSLVPQYYLRKLVANLLGVSRFPTPLHFSKSDYQDQTVPETSREVEGVHKEIIDIPRIVQWQFDHHKGFMHSFINTIRHGPYMYQHSEWEGICNVIKGEIRSRSGLFNGKILVVFGDTDGVVVEKDVSADLSKMIGGSDHITFRSVPGGHGFPIPSCEEVIKHISEFWGLHVED